VRERCAAVHGTRRASQVLVRQLILLGVLLFSACADATPASSPAPAPAASTVALPAGMSRVTDRSHVCMVNDFAMGRPQIPVEVGGRTYFGCCPDCKLKLETREAARTASDPVTGEPVDKATAVIVRDASGKVYYFASEDTLRRFRG
jgi:YHS domain-containing protein